MAKYRKIDPRIWNDEKFNSLSDNAKLLYFNLLTHPHLTMLGAMRASIPGLASELGWAPKDLREALAEALSKGMVKHSERASFFWLPNFLKYNKPESPNVVKSWESALDYLPECDLKIQLIQHVKEFVKGLPEAFRNALPIVFAKTMPNQEQEHEQEQDINIREVETSLVCGNKNSANTDVQEIFQYWQQVMNHPQAKLDSKRAGKIKQALKLGYTLEQLKSAIDGCKQTPFNMGDNEQKQQYNDVTLILRDANHIERFMQAASGVQIAPDKNNADIFAGVL